MTAAVIHHEPVGIVVQDGGDGNTSPRIMLWHWAIEEETPESER